MLRCCRETRYFARLCLFPNHRLSDCSAAAISGIAPRRHQQRHVVMTLRFGDRKSHRHHVEEWRISLLRLNAREIIADMKPNFLTADRQRPIADQRGVGAAVAIAGSPRDNTLLAAR